MMTYNQSVWWFSSGLAGEAMRELILFILFLMVMALYVKRSDK